MEVDVNARGHEMEELTKGKLDVLKEKGELVHETRALREVSSAQR